MSSHIQNYFDEAYFQEGHTKGTAYVNYREAVRKSPIFRDIAAAVYEVFRPRRALEIGCATGIIVKHLNALGCEAHGIDVSEWAVRNAEHRNVRLASADNLPYPDGHFDLVLSCHSLEHLPDSIFDTSIRELTRVGSAFQFHMMPIVGLPPYDGPREIVVRELKKDPTHQQLRDYGWWTGQFQAKGHCVLDTSILLEHDTEQGELTSCQFAIKAPGADEQPILRRAAARNRCIFRKLRTSGADALRLRIGDECMGSLTYGPRVWKDSEARLRVAADFSRTIFNLALVVTGKPAVLRFAAGCDDYSSVAEYHLRAEPGFNYFRFGVDQLTVLRGTPDFSRISRVAVGGENDNSDIIFFFVDQAGRPIIAA